VAGKLSDLSDQAWADICAAAGHAPDAEARAVLSNILFNEYPAFHYDRKRVDAALRRAERMLKALKKLAADYCAQFTDADVRTERDLWALEMLRRRAEAVWLVARAIRRAHRGRQNVQREFLYHRLCSVWLDHFHATELKYSRPSKGGDPFGPLIDFMLAAMRQIVSELPDSETVADAIDRERIGRENARQLSFYLERRSAIAGSLAATEAADAAAINGLVQEPHGGLTLKKYF